MVNRLINVLSLVLLAAVLWLFVNATVNRHTHHTSDGFIISHAHPYDKDRAGLPDSQSHDHSQTELILLNLFSNPFAPLVLFMVLNFITFLIRQLPVDNRDYNSPVPELYQVHHYHAPPAV